MNQVIKVSVFGILLLATASHASGYSSDYSGEGLTPEASRVMRNSSVKGLVSYISVKLGYGRVTEVQVADVNPHNDTRRAVYIHFHGPASYNADCVATVHMNRSLNEFFSIEADAELQPHLPCFE